MAGEFSLLRGMMQAAREERYDEAGEGEKGVARGRRRTVGGAMA